MSTRSRPFEDPTPEEVGRGFEVTRERLRPISASALRKLTQPSRLQRLEAFIED